MQDLQPKLKALQEKYKNDKEKLNQATMKLYQEEKVNPLAGCLPLLGNDLNVLPILMSVAMYFQTKFTPSSAAGGQMAMMNTMLPLVMIFIFYNMPSGLVLYWLVNTIMQGYQSWQIHRTAAPVGGGTQTA